MGASELRDNLIKEYENLYTDCNYSSLTYFNAAKSADRWAKGIVFWPAVVSAVAALMVAVNFPKQIGAVSAIASAVVATASYLGAGKRADSLRDSAKKLTILRHKVRLEMHLESKFDDAQLESSLRDHRTEYAGIVSSNELVADKFYAKAKKQIKEKALDYS